MLELLLEPFHYPYIQKAMLVSSIVGVSCAFLSTYLILKGWALIGDAFAHSVVPGVALAYSLKLPYILGAFTTAFFSSLSILIVKAQTKLKEDTIIGLVFTSFFALGLLIISINPTSIRVQTIIFGNILAINQAEFIQVLIISLLCFIILLLKWKDFFLIFFDENHFHTISNTAIYKVIFFFLIGATSISALQTVGVCLVISMLITPGATGYLLSNKFSKIISIACFIGFISSILGIYLSYFLDTPVGGTIVVFQTILFLIAFFTAPKYRHKQKRRTP